MSWYQEHQKAAWTSVIALVAVLLVGGIFYFVHAREEDKAKARKQSQQKAKPVRVRIVYPKEGGVERLVTRPGTVQSFEYAELYAKVSGYLRNQKVDIGSRVQKDEVMAEVYAPEKFKDVEKAEADLRKAKADLKAAKAHLNRREADQLAAESRYEETKAGLKEAQALVALRRKTYKRYRGLAEQKALDWERVDEAEEAKLAAEAGENAATKAVNTALSELGAAKAAVAEARADIETAEAAIAVAEAVLDRAEVYANYTRIVSPYTGVVTKRSFHNGDFIRAAGEGGIRTTREEFPVLAVARIDKMRIVIYVPDRAVPYLTVDDEVKLDIDALPDQNFQGKIARLAYAESLESRTMRAEVDMENPDGLLKAGMYGKMSIHLGREDGVRVPSTALSGQEQGEERSVFVVHDGKAHKVKVRVGIDDGIEATVRDGLSASDAVVAERPKGLKDGMQVKVIGKGLEKSPIPSQVPEDKPTGGKKGGGQKEKSKREGQQSPAKSNVPGGRESQRPSTELQQERKEFESSGDEKDSKQKKNAGKKDKTEPRP